MSKHTPGPWSEDPEGELAVSVEGADGSVVCDVHGASNDPLCEANCSLISAAPDMLAALKRIIADDDRSDYDAIGEAMRAVAKAEGKEQRYYTRKELDQYEATGKRPKV